MNVKDRIVERSRMRKKEVKVRILGLKNKVIEAINRAISTEGGYVDPSSVKCLTDDPVNIYDREEITLTLVFREEYRSLSEYIERCVRQAIHNLYSYPGRQDDSLSPSQDLHEEANQGLWRRFVERKP